jgi:Na+-translocating ferredoxin:NAD+ oxidoreductase RnfD subunit
VCAGTFLNARFTRRLPLIAAWLVGFGLQAGVRHVLYGSSLIASFGPMTGVAFLLFTFYMLTDPATTPSAWRAQVVFGAAVAAAYGVLMSQHIVFGLFFALALVCVLRTIGLLLMHWRRSMGAAAVSGDLRTTPQRVATP